MSLDAVMQTIRPRGDGPVVFITGAGVSAESGIPTFRGPEGYWRIGSRHYHPQELATNEAFTAMPQEVWAWYLFRRGVCRAAEPNAAHLALATLEEALGDRFLLVTQNVDGLHVRAGNSPARTYEIHGSIDRLRCANECSPATYPIPDEVPIAWPRDRSVDPSTLAFLRCPQCRGPGRPHVLWFDECYDEPRYRWDSSLVAAGQASVLVVAGTSGSTNLPIQMTHLAAGRGIPLVVLNPEPTVFSRLAEATGGLYLEGTATALVPTLASRLAATLVAPRTGDA